MTAQQFIFSRILVLILLLWGNFLFAKETLTIFDSETGQPVQFALVKLYENANDSLPKLSLKTNRHGVVAFSKEIKFKYINVQAIGYKSSFYALDSLGETKSLKLETLSYNYDVVLVTGQYFPTTLRNSLYDTKIISNEQLKATQAPTLREALQYETNIRINQDPVLGSSISMGGVSGNNIKILIDGVPVIGRLGGNIDISQLPMHNTERIEIVQGPMSTIYGSDALGGVINIITKANKGFLSANVNTYYESVGVYNASGALSGSIDDYNLDVNFARNFFGGYSPDNTGRDLLWNPKEQYSGGIAFGKKVEDHSFKLNFNFLDELILDRGDMRPPFFETARDNKFYTTRLNPALFYNRGFGTNQNMDFTVSFSHFERVKNTYFKNLVTLEEVFSSASSDHDTSLFQSWLIRAVYADNRLNDEIGYQAGIDFNLDYGYGKRIIGNSDYINDYAAFATFQYSPLQELTLVPSLRAAYNTSFDVPLIPAFNIKFNYNKHLVLRASIAKGYRAPSLRELNFIFVDINHNITGNPNLNPESSMNYIVSGDYSHSDEDKVFKTDMKLFYNKIENMINLASLGGSRFQYINTGRFTSVGGEVSLSYFRKNLSSSLSMNYTGRNNFITEGFIGASDKLFYTPEVRFTLNYETGISNSTFNIYYKYTGPQAGFMLTEGAETQNFELSSFNILDLTMSLPINDLGLNFVFGGKNLLGLTDIRSTVPLNFGAHNTGTSNLPSAWGRTFFISLSYLFGNEN